MPSEIELAIFDMDDLMINSHPAHMEVFEAVANKHGTSILHSENPLTPQEEAAQFGRRIKDILTFYRGRFGVDADEETLEAEFNELLLPVFGEHIAPMPGLLPLIESLKRDQFKLALASSAVRPKIDIVLAKFNLTGDFNTIVSGEQIKNGKPAPDIFLKAAEDAGIDVKRSVILEDANNGIQAAKAAGAYAIGVHNRFAFERLGIRQDLSKADLEVESLEEVTPSIIRGLPRRPS